jgi:hypothetical protein
MEDEDTIKSLTAVVLEYDTLILDFEVTRRKLERSQPHVAGEPSARVVAGLADLDRDLMELRESRRRYAKILAASKEPDDSNPAAEKG